MTRNNTRKNAPSKSFCCKVRNVVKKMAETMTITAQINDTVDTVGNNYLPCQIATGDGQQNRSGNMIQLQSFHAKFRVTHADTSNVLRFVLYMPHDVDYTLSGVGIDTPLEIDEFTVLSDRLIACDTYNPVKIYNLFKKLSAKVRYFGNNATDLTKNSLKLYVVSDSGVVSHPALQGWWRLKYKDI